MEVLTKLYLTFMRSPYYFLSAFVITVLLLRWFTCRRPGHAISHLPGPPTGSWLVGNVPALVRPKEVGDAEFAWTKALGLSMRIRGTFGRDILFTADPKAMHYVLNITGYTFPKSPELRYFAFLLTGRRLSWVEGAQHSRHRKIMNPAFSYASLRAFLPVFRPIFQKTVTKWRDLVVQGNSTSAVVDVTGWLSRTALDTVGIAGFDYHFGAVDQENNELAKAYNNLFADTIFNLSNKMLALQDLLALLPPWLLALPVLLPATRLKRWRNYMNVARKVAQSLVDRALQSETPRGDIMSILVRANLSEDPKNHLKDEELLAQLTTLLLAGHESITTTVSWILYELSRHPECQEEVRKDLTAARAQAAQRGDDDIALADLNNMKYLLALIKETLRYYPIVPNLTRIAGKDDSIPFSMPQKMASGEMITEIPVRKGQRVMVSIDVYNRLPSLWGQDADIWRPERFLEDMRLTRKRVLGATFGSGLRNCIGWCFAMIEMQALLIELIDNFEFSPPLGNIEIVRSFTGSISPMIKGSNTNRVQMPLTITPIM